MHPLNQKREQNAPIFCVNKTAQACKLYAQKEWEENADIWNIGRFEG